MLLVLVQQPQQLVRLGEVLCAHGDYLCMDASPPGGQVIPGVHRG